MSGQLAEAAEVNGACHLFSITRASARTGHTHVELELPPHYFGSAGYSLPIERTILRPSRVTMMTDFLTAKIRSHRRNIQRYSRLLATSLSELERQYLHKRIADEKAELERWEMQSSQSQHAAGTPPVENDSGAAGAASPTASPQIRRGRQPRSCRAGMGICARTRTTWPRSVRRSGVRLRE